MNNYLLNNYSLSKPELLQSLFLSEYGLRHWTQANIQPQHKWGHRIIAFIELCPLIGLIATIIEAIFVKFLNRNWLFRGSQEGCHIEVPVAKVETIWTRLVAQSTPGIRFNKNKIKGSVKDGACTAMSLEFIDKCFEIKKTLPSNSGKFISHIAALGAQFKESSEMMRTRQAAYNTIEVVKSGSGIDYSKNKMQALAKDYRFHVNYSSKEIDVEKLNTQTELEPEIKALPEGIFILRILKPSNNEKLEEHGHSLVYIKERDVNLFYDPNFGARNLKKSAHSSVLFDSFKDCFARFQVSKARFYRLEDRSGRTTECNRQSASRASG